MVLATLIVEKTDLIFIRFPYCYKVLQYVHFPLRTKQKRYNNDYVGCLNHSLFLFIEHKQFICASYVYQYTKLVAFVNERITHNGGMDFVSIYSVINLKIFGTDTVKL